MGFLNRFRRGVQATAMRSEKSTQEAFFDMLAPKDSGVITLQSVYVCPKLYARKLWEWLYRNTNIKEAESFDSFLCDLQYFDDMIKKGKTFWWYYNDNGSGYTCIADYKHFSDAYRIEVTPGHEIRITREE